MFDCWIRFFSWSVVGGDSNRFIGGEVIGGFCFKRNWKIWKCFENSVFVWFICVFYCVLYFVSVNKIGWIEIILCFCDFWVGYIVLFVLIFGKLVFYFFVSLRWWCEGVSFYIDIFFDFFWRYVLFLLVFKWRYFRCRIIVLYFLGCFVESFVVGRNFVYLGRFFWYLFSLFLEICLNLFVK